MILQNEDPDLMEDEKSNRSPILNKAKKFVMRATKGLEVLEYIKQGQGLRHLKKITGKVFFAPPM
jgi:hypothetical protein